MEDEEGTGETMHGEPSNRVFSLIVPEYRN